MGVCAFFGHADAPETIRQTVYQTIEQLIHDGISTFYVGNHGNFDTIVQRELSSLCGKYAHVRYFVVLAYLPAPQEIYWDTIPTLLPEVVATVPKRFAVDRRNHWMVEHATHIVTFVHRPFGGAAKFKELSQRKNKIVINLE